MTGVLKKSSELRQGDTVVTHGMRVLLDRPIREYDSTYGPAFACRGLVTNIDEVAEADPWLGKFVTAHGCYEADGDTPGEIRWTIQANDRVSWVVDNEGK